ncbi:MAG: HDOD domain-containing protein [Planctomycetes bacterium]|nr:HDOD domain-containing protein [Planctomycetota bacterium]
MAASGLQRRKLEVLVDEVENLPTLPGVGHHLLSLLGDDRPSRRDLQLVVEADAALSARAVRLALQAGRPAEAVTSIDDVFDSVPLGALVADLLSIETLDPETAADLALARLWRHTLACGMAAQVIANRLGTVAPSAALLAGILHDIGQIALATALPRAYSQVLEHAQAAGLDLLAAERTMLGIDHAVLGKRLARRWGFSETLQNAIWLHHQSQIPAERTAAATLIQVVRLADLVVRQEGFGYQPSEQIHDRAAEVAERLGLSSASAHQVGRQVVTAFDLNAQPIGMDRTPALEEMWSAAAEARGRLGRLFRAESRHAAQAEAQARRADLLMSLNSRLAACRSIQDVLSTVAANAREALAVSAVAPYLLSRDGDYVEGVLCPPQGGGEHFIHGLKKGEGVEALSAEPAPTAAGTPVRAERLEAWLFERHGARLGSGPFYTISMTAGDARVGGVVFSLRPGSGELSAQQAGELAALASVAAVALKRVQAEADLLALSEELAEVNRQLQAAEHDRLQRRNVASLGEMAAGAAHEINNPLAIISGRAQQLAAEEKTPARQEMLKSIIQQAARISDIIADLRLFARPPAPQPEEVDPAALARQVAEEFLTGPQAADSPRIRLEAAEAAPKVRIDPAQVGGALREVVRNALEACSNGRGANVTIAVRSVAAQGAVRLIVTDDGPGMDPQVRARAFDPFFCGRDAGRHRGMGLPKAYQAVLASGGQMTLESDAGRGTTVRMTFPAAGPQT